MPLDASTAPVCGPLTSAALADMTRTFGNSGHRPSGDQWSAIADYLHHAERAANGELSKAVYLSAIPAGTGKSVAVAAFARAVVNSAGHSGVGVLIAVCRKSEAADMAASLEDVRRSLCLVVGKKSAEAMQPLGDHLDADEAQVVITTQAALKETLRKSSDFNKASRYFFQGQRRRVLLWDEAIAFNRPVILNNDKVVKLAEAMRRQSPDAAAAVKRWSADLDSHPGGLCRVPDFGGLGLDFSRLEQEAGTDEQAAQARALSIISGETGHVIRSNANAASLVTYIPELPPSLLPVLVTDASAATGVAHQSYEWMARTLRVVRLEEATKSYSNLTVRIVSTAASRSTYYKPNSHDGRNLIDMIVTYIRRCAPEQVLVVSYVAKMTMHGVEERTIREAVDARLSPEDRSRVRPLTWGSHTATNEHKDIQRMVFSGLYFTPSEAAYAASGAALGKPMNTADENDHPTADEVKDMARGMLRDSTLQAVLRGAARMGVDGDCGTQEVVIPQAPQTGLKDADYHGMFPGCTIIKDNTLMAAKPLKGNLLRLSLEVAKRQQAGDIEVTDASLYGALAMRRADYGRLKRNPAWSGWLASHGWFPARLPGGLCGVRR